MKRSYTVVLDRMTSVTGRLESEPYECAWADEAICYVWVHKLESGILRGYMEISPDGIHWADEGTKFFPIGQAGMYFVKIREFGGWLRLVLELDGGHAEVTTSLSLKG